MADVLNTTPEALTQQDVAEGLLYPLWRCIDESYKDRYKREIWEHFENALRSAAYTSRLARFLEIFRNRIPVILQAQYANRMNKIVASGHDEEILNWLRRETAYMTLLVRLHNEERKEQFKD